MDHSRRVNSRRVFVVFAGLASLAGFILLMGVLSWVWWYRSTEARPVIADTSTVVRQVQALNELSTVKYVLEKVVLLQDVKWYGENRLLMVAHGVAKAGVNLANIRPSDVATSPGRIRLQLPHAVLSDVYLDERHTQVIERTTGLLREFDQNLEQDARRQAVDQIRVAARDAGILKDADERARAQITQMLHSLGFVEVEVVTR